MRILESADDQPIPALRVSPSIHEGMVQQFAESERTGFKPEPDPVLTSLANAVRTARESAQGLVQLASAAYADASIPRAAAAIQVKASATSRGERVAALLDAGLAKATEIIAAIDKATFAPAAPASASALHMETEVRAALKGLKRDERAKLLHDAMANDDMALIGAVLRAPHFLTGMLPTELEALRHAYRTKHFAKEMARRERLAKAVEATKTAGTSFMSLVSAAAENKFVNAATAAHAKREALLQAEKEQADG